MAKRTRPVHEERRVAFGVYHMRPVQVDENGMFRWRLSDDSPHERSSRTWQDCRTEIEDALRSKALAARKRPHVPCLAVIASNGRGRFRHVAPDDATSYEVTAVIFTGLNGTTRAVRCLRYGRPIEPETVEGLFPIDREDLANKLVQARLAEREVARQLDSAQAPSAERLLVGLRYNRELAKAWGTADRYLDEAEVMERLEENVAAVLQSLPLPWPLPKDDDEPEEADEEVDLDDESPEADDASTVVS